MIHNYLQLIHKNRRILLHKTKLFHLLHNGLKGWNENGGQIIQFIYKYVRNKTFNTIMILIQKAYIIYMYIFCKNGKIKFLFRILQHSI